MDARDLEAQSQRLTEELSLKLCGNIRVSVNSLRFFPDFSNAKADIDITKIQHLKRVFRQEGCDRANPRHKIVGSIAQDVLLAALEGSRQTLADVKSDKASPMLHLPPGSYIRCAQGKSRVKALEEIDSDRHLDKRGIWWTIELYVDLSLEALEVLSDEFENERRFSDGYIAWKICQSSSYDSMTEHRWWARLSSSKAGILRRLLQHESLKSSFLDVLRIPGMRHGLQIGIWPEIFASKLDEEVGHYLNHIHDSWVFLMGSAHALQYVDTESVQCLQLRAPGASRLDDGIISAKIENKIVFKGIAESRRQDILARLRQFKFLIPSLHTLQHDCKYLRQCGGMLKRLLMGKCPSMPVFTVRQIAFDAFKWGKCDSWNIKSPVFLTRLKLLYLHIMQNLVALSEEHCLREDNEPRSEPLTYDQRAWNKLALQATDLGFASDEIDRLAAMDPDHDTAKKIIMDGWPLGHEYNMSDIDVLAMLLTKAYKQAKKPLQEKTSALELTSAVGERLSRRCGRQYSAAYAHYRSSYTQSVLNSVIQKGGDLTALLVWRSTFHAFWGHDRIDDNPDETDTNECDRNTTSMDSPLSNPPPFSASVHMDDALVEPNAELQSACQSNMSTEKHTEPNAGHIQNQESVILAEDGPHVGVGRTDLVLANPALPATVINPTVNAANDTTSAAVSQPRANDAMQSLDLSGPDAYRHGSGSVASITSPSLGTSPSAHGAAGSPSLETAYVEDTGFQRRQRAEQQQNSALTSKRSNRPLDDKGYDSGSDDQRKAKRPTLSSIAERGTLLREPDTCESAAALIDGTVSACDVSCQLLPLRHLQGSPISPSGSTRSEAAATSTRRRSMELATGGHAMTSQWHNTNTLRPPPSGLPTALQFSVGQETERSGEYNSCGVFREAPYEALALLRSPSYKAVSNTTSHAQPRKSIPKRRYSLRKRPTTLESGCGDSDDGLDCNVSDSGGTLSDENDYDNSLSDKPKGKNVFIQRRRWSELEERRLRSWKREDKSESWIAAELNRTTSAVKQQWHKMSGKKSWDH